LHETPDSRLVLLDRRVARRVAAGHVDVSRNPTPEDVPGLAVLPDVGGGEAEDEGPCVANRAQVRVVRGAGHPFADLATLVAVVAVPEACVLARDAPREEVVDRMGMSQPRRPEPRR